MPVAVAELLVFAFVVYAAIGTLFSVPFVARGVNRIDPSAVTGSWGFRLLILPACAALWPWLALRWARGTPPPVERTAHRARGSAGPRTDLPKEAP